MMLTCCFRCRSMSLAKLWWIFRRWRRRSARRSLPCKPKWPPSTISASSTTTRPKPSPTSERKQKKENEMSSCFESCMCDQVSLFLLLYFNQLLPSSLTATRPLSPPPYPRRENPQLQCSADDAILAPPLWQSLLQCDTGVLPLNATQQTTQTNTDLVIFHLDHRND
jgi:hypothetical protein